MRFLKTILLLSVYLFISSLGFSQGILNKDTALVLNDRMIVWVTDTTEALQEDQDKAVTLWRIKRSFNEFDSLHINEADLDTLTAELFSVGDSPELTISSGAITISKSYHSVDTESDASADDLDNISDGTIGQVVFFSQESSGRDVTFKDGTGNLDLNGDFAMSGTGDVIVLIFDGSGWIEVSRSDN